MLNFKKEHLFGVHQVTTDAAKSNNYQSYALNAIVGCSHSKYNLQWTKNIYHVIWNTNIKVSIN